MAAGTSLTEVAAIESRPTIDRTESTAVNDPFRRDAARFGETRTIHWQRVCWQLITQQATSGIGTDRESELHAAYIMNVSTDRGERRLIECKDGISETRIARRMVCARARAATGSARRE
jgi:hypothetical protein